MELMLAGSAGLEFDELELREEIQRRGAGGDFDGSVEKRRRTIRAIHGRRFVDFRAKKRTATIMEQEKTSAGRLKVGESVTEVRT